MMTMTSVRMFTSLSMTTPTAKVMASSPLTMTMEMLSKVMVISDKNDGRGDNGGVKDNDGINVINNMMMTMAMF